MAGGTLVLPHPHRPIFNVTTPGFAAMDAPVAQMLRDRSRRKFTTIQPFASRRSDGPLSTVPTFSCPPVHIDTDRLALPAATVSNSGSTASDMEESTVFMKRFGLRVHRRSGQLTPPPRTSAR